MEQNDEKKVVKVSMSVRDRIILVATLLIVTTVSSLGALWSQNAAQDAQHATERVQEVQENALSNRVEVCIQSRRDIRQALSRGFHTLANLRAETQEEIQRNEMIIDVIDKQIAEEYPDSFCNTIVDDDG